MSKTLNVERRADIERRDLQKPRFDPAALLAPPALSAVEPEPIPRPVPAAPTPVSAPLVLLESEAAPVPQVPPPAAAEPEPPAASPAVSISPDAVRYAHRWYSLLTFALALGVTLGIIWIVRTGLPQLSRPLIPRLASRPAPPGPPPTASEAPAPRQIAAAIETPQPAAVVPNTSVVPPPPVSSRSQRGRDPFTAVLAPEPEDAALAEARRVYDLMEASLREASRTIPAFSPDTASPADSLSVPDRN